MNRKTNFILQQGLAAPSPSRSSAIYSALLFQPRLVGVLALIGTAVHLLGHAASAAVIFGALAVLLGWSAAFPRSSPFDLLYNLLFSARSGVRLEAAPAPRRFAQLLASAFSLLICALLLLGSGVAALIVAALLLAAVAALVFGGLCLGSYVFHLMTGRREFANCTLPWSPPPA